MTSSLADVLQAARRARGLTQEQVADAAEVTQGALSRYENDERVPDTETLRRLAKVLGVTPSLLESAGRIPGAMAMDVHMRRSRTARATEWRRLEAKLNLYRLHARHLFEEISVRADQIVPRCDPFETASGDAARLVRMQWRMPVGPVSALTSWIEAAGCLVIEEDFGTERVDGLSQWIEDHPVVLMNTSSPTDRKRLTLAHELGHLCLHSVDVTADVEGEADAFAAEFLMPAEVIRPQLRNLTLGKLRDLKAEWGVSMQALIERAYAMRTVTAAQRTALHKVLSARGYRTREPGSDELRPERPRLAAHIGDVMSSKGLSEAEIARIAGYDPAETRHPFQPTGPRLRSV